MGFNAVEVIEPLDWDFTGRKPDGTMTPKWPKSLQNASGTITEPSDAAIGRFMDGMGKLMAEAQKQYAELAEVAAGEDSAAIAEAISGVGTRDVVKYHEQMAGLYSELCGGHPTKTQILQLPLRARLPFYTWLSAEVVNPEAGTGAGNGQVIPLPTAVAGSSST